MDQSLAWMERYTLLEERYDSKHHARRIEHGEVLHVLRPMTHDSATVMRYDERYTPLLKRAKLATVARVCLRRVPPFNPAALTAMIDRWPPETHSFHLPCGEMTITLEDTAMILGVSIRGNPVTGDVQSAGWVGHVAQFLGCPLPDVEAGKKRRTSGVPLRWIREQFGECPSDADEATVDYYCRAWVLHMFGTVLFPDNTGDTASWMYIPCLWNWDDAGNLNWGSAVLAFLYCQLSEACRGPEGAHSTQSGCTTLFQIWMWERLPVGRPHTLAPPHAWFPEGDPVVAPTVAHLYERASGTYHVSCQAYISYTNELDILQPQHVQWRPYTRDNILAMNLSSMCRVDEEVWTMRCPLICFYAVEYHLPHRVARQFGREQPCPLEPFSTSWDLHQFDRRQQNKETNFQHEHQRYIDEWQRMEQNNMPIHNMHHEKRFQTYLAWLAERSRLHLKLVWMEEDYVDIATSDEGENLYDQATRAGKQVEIAPVRTRAGKEIMQTMAEQGQELMILELEGNPDEARKLRSHIQRAMQHLRRIAGQLGYRAQDVALPTRLPKSSSRRCQEQEEVEGHADDEELKDEEEDDDEEDQGNKDDADYDEINTSQLPHALLPTQASQGHRHPPRTSQPPNRYTPGTSALDKGKSKASRR